MVTAVIALLTFLLGVLVGSVVRISIVPDTPLLNQLLSTPHTEKFKFWKPDPAPPKDYPVHSIPRTRGSWRKQKSALEAEHNSKQKELDALTGGI